MLRKTLALTRVAAWGGLLYANARPWQSLGGLVDERLRWWEWFTLWVLPAAGFTLGGLLRDAVASGEGRPDRRRTARLLFYPPLVLAGVAVPLLAWLGRWAPLGLVVTGWLAYTAGADVAWNVAPSFRPVDGSDEAEARGAAPWLPPWDRP